MQTQVFQDFSDFWRIAKHLTVKQRTVIKKIMPQPHLDIILSSFRKEGWEDLFMRNKLDSYLDEINRDFNINLVNLRCLVLEGRRVYVKKPFWELVNRKFKGYDSKHLLYIFGGYRAIETNNGKDEYQLIPWGDHERLESKE